MDRRPVFRWLNVPHTTFRVVGLALTLCVGATLSAQVVPEPVDGQADAARTKIDTDDASPSDSSRATKNEVSTPVEVSAPAIAKSAQDVAAPNSLPGISDAQTAVAASATDPISRDLQVIAQQARAQLTPTGLPKVETAHAQLVDAIQNLERFLATNPASQDAWTKFLRLDEIRAEVAKENPDSNVLVDLEMNMRQNYLGLELQPYTDVRDGLTDLVRAVRYGANPDQTIKELDSRLERLVESLNEPPTDPDSSRAESVGVITSYLHQSGQVPWAVAAMRAKFSQPNLQVYVPEMFLNRVLGRAIAQPSPVNECILGTHIVGNACLNGALTADLIQSPSGVSVCLNLSANMTSNNVGYNRGVVLTSIGSSPIHAAKLVHVTTDSISSQPASISSHLQSQITSIQHPLRIVRRIASKKAAESQPEANAIAEGRLQKRVRTQFDEQVEMQLAESRTRLASFQQQPRPEFRRIGLTLPTYSFSSSTDVVHAVMTHSAPAQLAASTPSSLPKDMSDLLVEAHQSAVMNTVDTFFGGRTLRNSDLDDLFRQFEAKVTDELAAESKSQEWSITFATFHPVQIEFDDGLVKITLRISQMTRGDQILKQPATIAASYRPTYAAGNLRLDREGTVDINFVGRSTGLAAVSMRAFLKGKFEDFFKPVLVDTPIKLGERFPKLPNLQISSIQLDNGWLQVGVK